MAFGQGFWSVVEEGNHSKTLVAVGPANFFYIKVCDKWRSLCRKSITYVNRITMPLSHTESSLGPFQATWQRHHRFFVRVFFYAFFLRSFREFFFRFTKFWSFQVFRSFWTRLDLFGSIRTCLDPFGHVRMHSDALGRFRKRLGASRKITLFGNFESFLDVLECF